MLTATQLLGQLKNEQSAGALKTDLDSRTVFQRMRRLGLYWLLRENGHPIEDNMPYTDMVKYAEIYQDKLDFSKVQISHDGMGGLVVKKPVAIISEERVYDKKVQDKKEEVRKMDKPGIMKLAKDLGVAVGLRDSDEEIIAKVAEKAA